MEKSSAKQAVEHIIGLTIFMPDCYKTLGVGQYVLTSNNSLRKSFQSLKSDDLKNIRPDVIFPHLKNFN